MEHREKRLAPSPSEGDRPKHQCTETKASTPPTSILTEEVPVTLPCTSKPEAARRRGKGSQRVVLGGKSSRAAPRDDLVRVAPRDGSHRVVPKDSSLHAVERAGWSIQDVGPSRGPAGEGDAEAAVASLFASAFEGLEPWGSAQASGSFTSFEEAFLEEEEELLHKRPTSFEEMLAKFDASFEGCFPRSPNSAPEPASSAHSGGSPILIPTALPLEEEVPSAAGPGFPKATEQSPEGVAPRSESGPSTTPEQTLPSAEIAQELQVPQAIHSPPQRGVAIVEVEDDPSPSSSPLCSGTVEGENSAQAEGSPSSHSALLQDPPIEISFLSEGESTPPPAHQEVILPLMPAEPSSSSEPGASQGPGSGHVKA
ncbi:fibrous sheath CABYR-binding protein-like [Juglans microcarpa x Juglans regia]|uniref:fibrous sheath CABYR-binding protein-like n=1 Tax=Juglans microcarpa x Juglans regia TaxID=2249226 RepID=UPI001B7E94D2|nr:fibrous sheath CABYR-binding protein-like [Juglans microcarpa x Juglans regia]